MPASQASIPIVGLRIGKRFREIGKRFREKKESIHFFL
jgi:hypothetical protein